MARSEKASPNNPESWRRVQQLFKAALQRSPGERTAFLQHECRGDEELFACVRNLLESNEASDSFLETPAIERFETGIPGDPAEALVGRQVGQYHVRNVIASGGMGTVYRAEQQNPRRTVALKAIRPGLASRELLRRFRHEAQVLGLLQHPGIAQIFEAGTADTGFGVQPFFAMEFVNGRPLTEHCRTARLNTRQRLALLVKVCDAVSHAHQKGIIHRDLKPGNILVVDAPADHGSDITTGRGFVEQPKVLDFGVARLTDADIQTTTLRTDVGQLIGTIPYMSPEQVAGDPTKLDTRSDVYALGVIMYELLTGRTPHELRNKTVPEAVRIIGQDDPTPLSSIDKVFRGDLETIVAKALEKDADRRYPSASDFAADITRYLADEPIAARPAGTWYQFRKFAKRNTAFVLALAALFVALGIGGVMTTWQALSARAEARRVERINRFLNDMLLAPHAERQGPGVTFLEVVRSATGQIEAQLGDEPDVEASVRQTIGEVLRSLNAYEEAEIQLRKALRIRQALHGDDHPTVADTLEALGKLLFYSRADLTEAEKVYRRALSIRGRFADEQSDRLAEGMNNLGELMYETGRLEAASRLFQRAYAIWSELDPQHPALADSVNNQAYLLHELGDFETAEGMFRLVVELDRERGEDGTNVATGLKNLGMALLFQYNADEAEPFVTEALAIRRKRLGEKHIAVADSLRSLGYLYFVRGDLSKSESAYRAALDIQRAAFEKDQLAVAFTCISLAAVLEERGDLETAREYLQRATRIYEGTPEADQRFIPLMFSYSRARIHHARGEYAAAARLYRAAADQFRETRGETNAHVAMTLNGLGLLMRDVGDSEQAESLCRQSLEMRRETLGEGHPTVASGLIDLADVLFEKGAVEESETLIREAVTIRRKLVPQVDWLTSEAESRLACVLATESKFAESERLALSSYDFLREQFGDRHARTLAAIRRIVEIYDRWNRPKKAAQFRAKLSP